MKKVACAAGALAIAGCIAFTRSGSVEGFHFVQAKTCTDLRDELLKPIGADIAQNKKRINKVVANTTKCPAKESDKTKDIPHRKKCAESIAAMIKAVPTDGYNNCTVADDLALIDALNKGILTDLKLAYPLVPEDEKTEGTVIFEALKEITDKTFHAIFEEELDCKASVEAACKAGGNATVCETALDAASGKFTNEEFELAKKFDIQTAREKNAEKAKKCGAAIREGVKVIKTLSDDFKKKGAKYTSHTEKWEKTAAYIEAVFKSEGLPTVVVVVLVIFILALVGGGGYYAYQHLQKKKAAEGKVAAIQQ